MAVRLKDIATRLGLSKATVSHVLNGRHEETRIRKETIERVRKMAEQLGYRPSALARAFREKRALSVGVAVEDLSNPFWTGVAAGVEAEAEKLGYAVMVSNTRGALEREQRAVQMLQENRIDGLIFSPIHVEDRHLAMLHREGRPLVQIDRSLEDVDIPCVRTDHEKGSALVVDHLVSRGHSSIAYVGGPGTIQTFLYREKGFRAALARHKLSPAAVLNIDPTQEAARAAVRRLISRSPHPSALFTANIWMSLGGLEAANDLGLSVPGDIEFAGFDEIRSANLLRFPITTVAQDVNAIGRNAFKLLLQIMNGRKAAREVVLPPKLIVRL